MFTSTSASDDRAGQDRSGISCLLFDDFSFWTQARQSTRADLLVVHSAGKVHSCSPLLYRLGLRQGDALDRARGLLTEVEFRPRDLARERIAMEELLDSLSLRTSRIKRLKDRGLPGEWVVLRDLCFRELAELAAEFKARAGMAPVLCWAMLAAASVPCSQAAGVPPAQAPAFLNTTPTRLLQAVGFSEYLLESLILLGFTTLKRCRSLSQRQLEARFGLEGKRLFNFIHPLSTEAVPVYRPGSLTAGCELDPPLSEPADLFPYLSRTLDQLLVELGKRFCESLCLTVSARDGRAFAGSLLLKAPSHEKALLGRRFSGLLPGIFRAGMEVCQLQLTLRGITPAAGLQQDFFKRTLDLARLRQTERRFPGKLLRVKFAAAPSLFPEDNTHFEPLFTQG